VRAAEARAVDRQPSRGAKSEGKPHSILLAQELKSVSQPQTLSTPVPKVPAGPEIYSNQKGVQKKSDFPKERGKVYLQGRKKLPGPCSADNGQIRIFAG